MGDAALQARLAPGDGLVHVARTGLAGGRASFEQLGFCYPLKLMPPRISAIDASIGKGVLCLYMLSYGEPCSYLLHCGGRKRKRS